MGGTVEEAMHTGITIAAAKAAATMVHAITLRV